MRPVSSWGRLSADPHHVVGLSDPRKVREALSCGAPRVLPTAWAAAMVMHA